MVIYKITIKYYHTIELFQLLYAMHSITFKHGNRIWKWLKTYTQIDQVWNRMMVFMSAQITRRSKRSQHIQSIMNQRLK